MTIKPSKLVPLFFVLGLSLNALAHGTDAFDAKIADIALLQPKVVQKDVGLTSAQREKLNVLATDNAKKIQAFLKDAERRKVDPSTITPANPTIARYYAELKEGAFRILTPLQVRRLRELTLQRAGTAGLTNPAVATQLGIGKAQEKQISKLVETFELYATKTSRATAEGVMAQYKNVRPKDQADLQRLQQESRMKVRNAELQVRPQIAASEKQMTAKVMLLLTPSQKAAWKALQGKEFKPS